MNDEIEQLRKEIEKLRKENEELKRELEKVRKEKEMIEKEYEEYKMRHPETVSVKHGKPYHIKTEVKTTNPKKSGARIGHEPHNRPLPKHIDETTYVPVLICPHCGGTELSDVQETRKRVYEDIPICKPVSVELNIDRRYCRTCKKLIEASISDVLPGARVSFRVMLIVVWLKIGLRMTEAAIPELLDKLFGFKISEGEVIHILKQVAEAFGPYYNKLIQNIRDAEARHIDETSWRINGQNVWLWAFVTKGEVLYKIASKRNHRVPLEVLGKKHNGVDIHDRFSAYKTLARKTGNPQQYSWSHILNDAKELAQFCGEEGEHIYRVLNEVYVCAKAFKHRGTDNDIDRLFGDMAEKLSQSYKSLHCYKFVVNLLKDKDVLFQFMKNPDVDGTNNAAERALRHTVIARKISGGNRTEKGARIYEILASVVQTVNRKGWNLLAQGSKILLTSYG